MPLLVDGSSEQLWGFMQKLNGCIHKARVAPIQQWWWKILLYNLTYNQKK